MCCVAPPCRMPTVYNIHGFLVSGYESPSCLHYLKLRPLKMDGLGNDPFIFGQTAYFWQEFGTVFPTIPRSGPHPPGHAPGRFTATACGAGVQNSDQRRCQFQPFSSHSQGGGLKGVFFPNGSNALVGPTLLASLPLKIGLFLPLKRKGKDHLPTIHEIRGFHLLASFQGRTGSFWR